MEHDGSEALKRFLLHLPTEANFKLTKDVKKQIRKALFMSISNDGKFLDWLFPNLTPLNDNNNIRFLISKLDNDFSWKFQEYHRAILAHREPRVDTDDHHAFHGKAPCARIFRKGEPIYRCLTCAFDETCALCCHCFRPEYHEGHKINIAICQRENGGVCDCGDPEAWLKDFLCPYGCNVDNENTKCLSKDMPNEFATSFLRTIEVLLDYVIDVMSQSDLQFEDPEEMTGTKVDLNAINATLDPAKYNCQNIDFMDSNNDKYFLLAYNDQIRYYRDAVQRIHLASKKVKEFAMMVTDKIQTSGRGKVISSSNIKLLMERQKILSATGLATCIRSSRDVFREDMCDEILLWLYDLTESELFKVNDTAKNLLCQAFCGKWENGLLVASKNDANYFYRVGTLDSSLRIPKIPSVRDPRTVNSHWKFIPKRWDLLNELCQHCNYNTTDQEYLPNVNHVGSRLQYLLYFDVRFWKSPRVLLHDIYSTSLITNLNYKNIICYQYVDIYPVIADMFLNMDREPELSVMCTLSTQLFTCPSNSTAIVQHGDITRILAAIYGFLTTEEIKTPESINLTNVISIKSLKNRRWGQIFFDLGYILSRNKEPKSILIGNIIPMACDLFALFQGKPVMRREKTNHVEYESTDYTAFFHAILVVYQFGEYVAQSLRRIEYVDANEKHDISRHCIQYVLNFLLCLENHSYSGLVDEEIDINHINEEICIEPISGKSIAKRNDDDKVCFLHPLHSFLSWLIEYSDLSSPSELVDIFNQASPDDNSSPSKPSLIFDYSIRTIVLMSQIKSGFWVRNGFSVRSQLQLYKNSALRENGYIRDLFLSQIFLNSNDPNLVCYQFLSRWFLLGKWPTDSESEPESRSMNDEETTAVYDPKTLPYILEEFMFFLIHLLTENIHSKGSNHESLVEARIKKEIIHNLCFGGMNYTKLCSQIPDHLLSEKRFDPVLTEITTFKAPKGTNDLGVYHLKEEYLDEMNPYYFNYTTNVKDDAIKFVKNRIHKKTGAPMHEIVIEPYKRSNEESGLFGYIANFSTSPYFAEFLIRVLRYIRKNELAEVDGILETTLHLIHICSYEEWINFEAYGTFYDKFVAISEKYRTSLASSLYTLLIKDEYRAHHCKVRSILRVFEAKYHNLKDILRDQVPEFDKMNIEIESSFASAEDEIARKKRIAKERQSKLLAKFKKQQNLFIKKNNFEANDVDVEMEDCAAHTGWNFPEPHCMLCQNAAKDAGPFGLITYISKTSEFRSLPFDDKYWFLKAFSDGADLDIDEDDDKHLLHNTPKSEAWKSFMNRVRNQFVMGPGFRSADDVESKLVSLSCGHGMHFQCYLNFLNTNKNKMNQITRNAPENIEHKEFVCPLCKAINNMFIPILWTTNRRSLSEFLKPSSSSNPFQTLSIETVYNNDWYNRFTSVSDEDIESMSLLTPFSREMLCRNLSQETNMKEPQHQFRLLLSNMFQILSFLTFPQVFKADSIFVFVNTIKAIEIALRGTASHGQLIINQLSNNCLINLRTLNEFRNTSILMKIKGWIHTPNPKGDGYAKLLAHLLLLSKESMSASILEIDFFECLVNILPLPSAGFSFHHILETAFIGHMIQTLHIIVRDLPKNCIQKDWCYSLFDIPKISNISSDVAEAARSCFVRLMKTDEHFRSIQENEEFGCVVYSLLVKSVTPFLRRAAIYAFVQCANIESIDHAIYSSTDLEANRLCTFLNLKPIATYLQSFTDPIVDSYEGEIFNGFVNYLNTNQRSKNIFHIQKKLEYPGIIKLVELPERLDYFFTKYYYLERYSNPSLTIEDPAVCLFCGDVVDAQKLAIGSIEGQCTDHYLKECAHDVGLFLLPKDRTLLLLHKNGGSFYNAPYLDEHGELPDESKKQKALYFLKVRYDDFRRNVWLQHNVPNYIVRNLENVLDPGGWETL